MKTIFLIIFGLGIGSLFFIHFTDSYSGARYPCCVEWALDKTEYDPGDIVKVIVTVTDELKDSNEYVTIKINEVTFGPDFSELVFEKTKLLNDENLIFEYKIPENVSEKYRYLVSVSSPARDDSEMFFTKKDASKIIISDIQTSNSVVKQGDSISIKAKVVDGVGNPSHYLSISASDNIPHQNCNSDEHGWAGAHTVLSPLRTIQPEYWSSGIISGDIKIKDTAKPGTYNFILYAGGTEDGYQNIEKTFPVEILEYDGPRDPPYTVFSPFEYNFGNEFLTEQPIEITAYTAYNGCGPTISNIPIKAEFLRYDLKNHQWMETIKTKETMSDENGEYNFYFEPIGMRPGYYTIQLTSTYQGIENTIGSQPPSNIKNFTIVEEGKKFVIPVDGNYFIPQNVTFDKENKTLTLELDTDEPFRQVEFSIPTELLDGDFVVYVNGIERDGNIKKYDGYTRFSPWPGEDDHTIIEVIGTSAIPEFQTVVMFVLLLSMLPVILLRKQLILK